MFGEAVIRSPATSRMPLLAVTLAAGDRLTTKLWPGRGHVFDVAMRAEAFAWLDR
ncbi:hypothetical protein Ade02nite_13010 [Paractinoplanes deccanensis]|uniref:Uncharacterized protein n=1 Tax=Paractinoplanes deccanensis TaxID=113561 RepID=A0ABQ3XYE4_9ACTN|nr:hypothetical protein [Actinoplanes deccanensis]GID72660.1 hypothetical protein Ade02nite_13010 [Actinoplanes deccanensis]